jgi:N-acetylated-alpha-linked acidic dipeptidase
VIGPYHSTYDDLFWVQHFGADKRTFDYYVTLAQLLGLGAMELADNLQALSAPDLADDLLAYYQSLLLLIEQKGIALDTTDLATAITAFSQAAQNTLSAEQLLLLERQFLDPSGLPQRPFYRHLLQAPGINLGYGSIVFPGVSEAVQAGDVSTATAELARLVQAIQGAADFLQE